MAAGEDRSADRCLALQFSAVFVLQPADESGPLSGYGSQSFPTGTTRPKGPAMDTIAPALLAPPAELRHRRVRLELGSAAAAHASGHVRTAITAWSVPVDPAVAVLLTTDLVINAVTNGAAGEAMLSIRWSSGQFR